MRKNWLAVLSILGLAGSTTPASAQVLTGAKKADSKSESTLKKSKHSQEDAASKDASTYKSTVQSVEGGKATSDAAMKYRKAGGDQTVEASQIDKGQKANAERKASQGAAAYKEQKAVKENSAAAIDSKHKAAAAELKATQKEATIKLTNAEQKKQVDAASPK